MKLQPAPPLLFKCHPLRVPLLQTHIPLVRDLRKVPHINQAVDLTVPLVLHLLSMMNQVLTEDKWQNTQTPLGVMGATSHSQL